MKGSHTDNVYNANTMPMAGSSIYAKNGDPKMQFMTTSQRTTGVAY
jgi:hypothetical protein